MEAECSSTAENYEPVHSCFTWKCFCSRISCVVEAKTLTPGKKFLLAALLLVGAGGVLLGARTFWQGLDIPGEALQAATRISAEAIGLGQELGTIEPGKAADLVAFDGDPTEDVSAFSRVVAVFQEGVRIS